MAWPMMKSPRPLRVGDKLEVTHINWFFFDESTGLIKDYKAGVDLTSKD